jgi:hypothetical protein
MRVSISIPYPGWATIGQLDMEEAFIEAANMSVLVVVVAGGGSHPSNVPLGDGGLIGNLPHH